VDKLTFDDYAYHSWTTAFFLDAQEQEQYKIVHSGFNEEIGELLTDQHYPVELTSKLWGITVSDEISQKLNSEKVSEAGDVLYYIAAAGILRNIPLRDIAAEAIEHYTGGSAVLWDESISGLDQALATRMGERVPEKYKPDYRTWKLWDFAPFENGLHIVLREPTYAKGPLQLIPDGRYALERLHSTLGRFMHPETSNDAEFIASAGLALGGLSIVLQNRFDGSLQAAAENNMAKTERRHQANTLKDGIDTERSRRLGHERLAISDEDGTNTNLLNAPLPEL
jgi:hypothetical protein